ncbi:MAG TPA: hypothetical protein VK386_00110 [Acidimicrobiales bacterium]|nr:hypothetical protein [Acidimicrobiales bacterium]
MRTTADDGSVEQVTPGHPWLLAVVAMIGVGLMVAPLVFGMFSKAPKGAVMISAFKPYMTVSRLDGYQDELSVIDAGVHQTDTSVARSLDPASGGRQEFDAAYPDFASFDRQWPAIDSKMTGLMDQVQANLGNYLAVAALPSFRLFPWFFVIPGALVAAVAIAALLRPSLWGAVRWVLVVLGISLVAAPVAFQMFGRAPDGGRMMTAFKSIETTGNVEQIQGYFGSMAVGQGAIRLDIVPALEAEGLSQAQVAAQFPAVARLDADWVHILNDMTPMIGTMSDNVVNYQAVASLPPFPLFPWFFVIPGVLVTGLALAAGVRRPGAEGEPDADAELSSNQPSVTKGAS